MSATPEQLASAYDALERICSTMRERMFLSECVLVLMREGAHDSDELLDELRRLVPFFRDNATMQMVLDRNKETLAIGFANYRDGDWRRGASRARPG